MKRRFDFMLMISLAMFAGCAKQGNDERTSTASDTTAVQRQLTPSETDATANESDSAKSDYPYGMRWIPGQRDTEDFDVLSKFRAHANRFSKDVLVLTLDTPATGLQRKGTGPKYVVADSAVITGLSPGELFKEDCRIGSRVADGRIGGIPSTATWDRWQRPRLAWLFDTVSVRINSIATDSVSCMLVQPDY